VDKIERHIGRRMEWVSGGSSANIPLFYRRGLPDKVNHLRIGEALLLGRDAVEHESLQGFHQDAFKLYSEVLEVKTKLVSEPEKRGQNAFNNKPEFNDEGKRLRAILAVGRQDLSLEGLQPIQDGFVIEGASSDHLILDVKKEQEVDVYDEVGFTLDYPAMLSLMTSKYVDKKFLKNTDS